MKKSPAFVALCSCTFRPLLSFFFVLVFSLQAFSQDSTVVVTSQFTDSIVKPVSPPVFKLTDQQIKSRSRLVAIGNIVAYGGTLIGLNEDWYANYPRSSFHFFNDNNEWLQVDKVGHMYSAYIESRGSMELWRWTGVSRKKRIWLGGLSGVAYQSIIEVLDGFSAEWGFSWGDFTANVLGSGALISQELAWDDQRIKLKFSFHRNNYSGPQLEQRANEIYGSSESERFLKDYNAQTYWASADIKSFFPRSHVPGWLAVSFGYGADGMFGATQNIWTEKNNPVPVNRTDIKRFRQWYLAPDIDLSKIKTRKKGIKFILTVLSAFKFPLPSLEFSNGGFKFHAIDF